MVLEHCEFCHRRDELYRREPHGGHVCRDCARSRPKIWINMAAGWIQYDPVMMKYRLHQITRSGILTDRPDLIVDKNGKIVATHNKRNRGRRAKYNSEIIVYKNANGEPVIELVYYNMPQGAKRFQELTGMTHAQFLQWKRL